MQTGADLNRGRHLAIYASCTHPSLYVNDRRVFLLAEGKPPTFGALWNNRPFSDKVLSQRYGGLATMPQILNCSEHANDEEVHYLTTLLLYHLVERCGGHLQFTAQEVRQIRDNLSTKMVQIQLGNDVQLRIIDRLPELQ